MQSKAPTVDEYPAELPEDRRSAIQTGRRAIRKSLDVGFAGGMQYGMIGWHVPHKHYPPGYHCDPTQPLPFVALASQKYHMSLQRSFLYTRPDDEARFRDERAACGEKPDTGKSCIRFKKLDDIALDVIGAAVARVRLPDFIRHDETAIKPASASASRPIAGRATGASAKSVSNAVARRKKK